MLKPGDQLTELKQYEELLIGSKVGHIDSKHLYWIKIREDYWQAEAIDSDYKDLIICDFTSNEGLNRSGFYKPRVVLSIPEQKQEKPTKLKDYSLEIY